MSVIFQDLEKYRVMAGRKERRIYHVAKIVKVKHQKGCLGTYWQKKSPVIVKQFFRLSAQSYVCRRNSCKDVLLFYELLAVARMMMVGKIRILIGPGS